MELYEANRILRSVKAAATADGFKLPSSAETDGLMMLLGKLDTEKYIVRLAKHCSSYVRGSANYDRAIRLCAFFRALLSVQAGLYEKPTVASLVALNKTLFGDACDSAGKLRESDAFTDGNAHTDPKYITGSLKAITAKMSETAGAPATGKEDFAIYLSHYMRELIILHPLEIGSEFTIRIFILMFCKTKGFALYYYRATPASVRSAETDALATDDVTPLFTLFTECLAYDYKTATTTPPAKTRRETDKKDLCRTTRQSSSQIQPGKQQPNNKKSRQSEDDVLKRAVRLQQKISKLNDQLTELMRPIEKSKRDKNTKDNR